MAGALGEQRLVDDEPHIHEQSRDGHGSDADLEHEVRNDHGQDPKEELSADRYCNRREH